MSILSKGKGIFSLSESDKTVGSYIIKNEIPKLLPIKIEDLADIDFEIINETEVIDELKLMKLWYGNKIPNAKYTSKISLDEIILKRIIEETYPESEVIAQERVGRYLMDLKVSIGKTTKYIEFDGPHHFASTRYGPPRKHPFDKKKLVEDKTGIEVINWPYWIQRCTRNVKSIFEESNDDGLGALWSTNIHFGDFVFDDSAEIIQEMSSYFGAWDTETGVCDYYLENSKGRIKAEHPIIEKIQSGKESKEKLLPKGYQNLEHWVPEKIR